MSATRAGCPLATRGRGETFATLFDPRSNSLNFLRLLMASLVIVSHSWPLGGYGADPAFGDLTLGDAAVAGFFAISGWLIMSSRLSTSLLDFLWRRVLRIYPAFMACLIIVAFVFAPLSQFVGPGTFHPVDGVSYVIRNSALLIRQHSIGDTLSSVPFPSAWDGALWTLFIEFVCYLVVAGLVSVLPRRLVTRAAVAVLLIATVVQAAIQWAGFDLPEAVDEGTRLLGYFFAGSVLYLFRKRVRVSRYFAVAAVVTVLAVCAAGSGRVLAGLPIAYLCLWLGVRLPYHKTGRPNDFSYGVYIYGWPVQQSLVLIGADRFGVAGFIFLSIILTIPFAITSWFLVEKRVMKYRRLGAPLDGRLRAMLTTST